MEHRNGTNWFAVYTKPKQEDAVACRLEDVGLEILNPKLRSRKYRHSKFTDVIEPLFPCYLFASFDENREFRLVNYTRGVRYILGKNSPVIVPEGIIDVIKQNMEGDSVVKIKPENLKKGDKVKIKDGPFKDLCGIFERETKGPERVLILLDTIAYKLELDSRSLVKV